MRPASVTTIAGAGHMGPFTHARSVADAIATHIVANEARVAGRVDDLPVMRAAA